MCQIEFDLYKTVREHFICHLCNVVIFRLMIDLGIWFTQITDMLRTDAGNSFTSDTATWVDTCKDDDQCLTFIDTATSYITMPSTEYNSLVTYLNSVVSNCVTDNSQFMCPESNVDELPTVWFQLGGHAYHSHHHNVLLIIVVVVVIFVWEYLARIVWVHIPVF